MGISELCIRRPVFTSLVTMTIIVFGVFAYRLLPVAALPSVEFPTITVNANLSGASPETMAASVAAVIERELAKISGIRSITSTSTLGRTRITVQFDLERDIDGAALDVQSALSVANRRMPPEMDDPPSFRKVNPGDFSILVISLRSATLPLSTVDEYAQTVLAQQISQLPGVAQVDVNGSQKFAVRVQVDPNAAAARNISLEEIRRIIVETNSNSPVGTLFGDKQNTTLVATGAMQRAEEYKRVVVAYRNGAPVKLDEIARVVDAVENDKIATWFNDERAIVLGIQKQPGANTIAVVDSIRERLDKFRAQVPPAISLEFLNDRSVSIRESVHDVQVTLAIAVALVVLVIFLFLRSVSATIIPALAVPVSLIGTCAAMYALGFLHQQHDALGLDPVGRFRGRRCHRHAGEHRPPYRKWHASVRSGAERRTRDRLHHRFDNLRIDSGVHSGLVDGRYRRPCLPRICRYRGGGNLYFRFRFADANSDVVRTRFAPSQPG